MKPIEELRPLAGRLRGLFCDFDDTITHAGAVVPAAYAELCRAAARGWRVVVVTGRPAGWAEVLAATWPLAGTIAENGAFAVRRRGDGGLERLYWQPDAAARADERRRLEALAASARAAQPEVDFADDQWLRRVDVAFDIGERRQLPAEAVAALTARLRAGGARVVTSSVHAHATFGDYDKARMCERLVREAFGEDLAGTRADYVFVGDSPNDQACFAWFPHAVGVANVARYRDRLAPPPGYVTGGEGGHGLAELIRLLVP